MSAGAPKQPTKAARSLGPSRPQSAWARMRHGVEPKEARGQLQMREKHAAMRAVAQLRESAVAGNRSRQTPTLTLTLTLTLALTRVLTLVPTPHPNPRS
jgi:hypothetical protein